MLLISDFIFTVIRNKPVSKFKVSGCRSSGQGSVTDKIGSYSLRQQVGKALALSGLLFSGYLVHFHERIKRPGREDVHSFLGEDVNLAWKNINIIENN